MQSPLEHVSPIACSLPLTIHTVRSIVNAAGHWVKVYKAVCTPKPMHRPYTETLSPPQAASVRPRFKSTSNSALPCDKSGMLLPYCYANPPCLVDVNAMLTCGNRSCTRACSAYVSSSMHRARRARSASRPRYARSIRPAGRPATSDRLTAHARNPYTA